jgi:uncharacterized protein (DUF1015 family)
MAGPVRDRLALLRSVRANLSPVYGVLTGRRGSNALGSFLDAAVADPPAIDLTDESGTRHRLWVVPGGQDDVSRALRAEQLLIADGHHRYSVALAYREEMRAVHGPGPWDAMMMFIVDAGAEDPPVLPIHRVLVDGRQPRPTGERVLDLAEILATVDDDDLTYGLVTSEDGDIAHRVATLPGKPPTVCALHAELLDRLPDAALSFIPDAATAEAEVLGGRGSAAFILPATTVERVWNVVRAGGTLPQKSTYFWPKPRTGFVIRPLDP